MHFRLKKSTLPRKFQIAHTHSHRPWNCIQAKSYFYSCEEMLQRCSNVETLNQVLAHVLTARVAYGNFLAAKLVNLYAVFGNLQYARQVFNKIPQPNIFSWNTIIRAYARNRYFKDALSLCYQMQRAGMESDVFTFPFALKACSGLSALHHGKEIHCHVIKNGFDSDAYVAASLLDMYAKSGKLENAQQVFDKMSKRDVVSWTAIIAGYAQNGCLHEAMLLFRQMQLEKQTPGPVALLTVLSGCAQVGALPQVRSIHNYICKSGYELDVSMMNSLIDVYGSSGEMELARKVFDTMSERDVISWSSMIGGYAKNGSASEALNLFKQMLLTETEPNFVTVLSVLSACTQLEVLQTGEGMHSYIIRSGFESNVFVGTGLIDMYVKCGNLEKAYKLFSINSRKDFITWSAMIAGYAQNGHAYEALALFSQMHVANMRPDSATIVSVLHACTQLGALRQGRCLHNRIIRCGIEVNAFVETALVDMYAKCGIIEIARQVFEKMSSRDVVSWSSMIAGYGMHGRGKDALAVFSQMQETSIQPNHITFVSVLSACSHAGLVDEGWHYFDCMTRDYSITPRAEHYACMVDLLSRAGNLDEAEYFIRNMPIEPDANVWGTLLGACRIHSNVALGERAAKHLFHLSPSNAGYHILLSNIYAAGGRWDEVAKLRATMKEMGLTWTPGRSFIEINKNVHVFYVEDITPLG